MEITAHRAIKVARETYREGREKSKSRNEERRKREKCRNKTIEKRGYIIYTGLKGLHKNGRTAEKNDRRQRHLVIRRALSSRKQRLFYIGDKGIDEGSIGNRETLPPLLRDCVAPAIVISVDEPDKTPRSMQRPSHRSNKVRFKFVLYIHIDKNRNIISYESRGYFRNLII